MDLLQFPGYLSMTCLGYTTLAKYHTFASLQLLYLGDAGKSLVCDFLLNPLVTLYGVNILFPLQPAKH